MNFSKLSFLQSSFFSQSFNGTSLFQAFQSHIDFLNLLCLPFEQQEQLIVVRNEVLVIQVLISSGNLVIVPAVDIDGVEFTQSVHKPGVGVSTVMLLATVSVQVVDRELTGRIMQAWEV